MLKKWTFHMMPVWELSVLYKRLNNLLNFQDLYMEMDKNLEFFKLSFSNLFKRKFGIMQKILFDYFLSSIQK